MTTIEEKNKQKFTEEDVKASWDYYLTYFVEALNGETTIEQLRDDLSGLIGSEYDKRIIKLKEYDNK